MRLNVFPTRQVTAPMERGQLVLLVLLALLTAGAWALTIHQARTMDMPMGVVVWGAVDASPDEPAAGGASAGMDGMAMDEPAGTGMGQVSAGGMSGMTGGAWSWDGFVAFVVAWAVMMAAMMFPAAAPMLLLFRRIVAQRKGQGPTFVPTWVFATGYLLVWTAIGGVTWGLVQVASDLAGRLGSTDRETWAPLVLGAVLVMAGVYQLTPLKRFCLDHCRTPLGFVMTHWRDGSRGALRMGVIHGAYCLGCCWALFVVLVAAGVMSLAWMLVLTLIVFAEKVLPVGPRAAHATGATLLILGVLVAVGAADIPWSA